MIKKVAIITFVIVASLLVAGCTSPTNSNQAASSASSAPTTTTANTTIAKTTSIVRASPSPIQSLSPTPIPPTPTPTPTPTPSPTIQVIISGPTTINDGQGGQWTATVLVNGKALPQDQLTGKMNWFIDGKYHPTNTMTGATVNGAVMVSDANGSETTWAPNGVHTLNAEYLGDPSLPNTSITVTKVTP